MLEIMQRLQEYYNLSQTPLYTEDAATDAGRKAELFLRQMVENHVNYEGAHTFIGKRVPSLASKRKEIDLLVVSAKRLHVLEVKNWSGELRKENGKWVQLKRNGERVECPNLVSYNAEKCDLLRTYLAGAGILLPPEFISQKVVFMNTNLRVDSAIATLSDVITPDKLSLYLDASSRQSAAEKILLPLIRYCLSSEQEEKIAKEKFASLSQAKLDDTVSAISSLGSWDRLFLHGNKVLTGDLLKIQTQNFTVDRQQLDNNVNKIVLQWTRNKWGGFLKAFLGIGRLGTLTISGYGEFALKTADFVKFQDAGAAEPSFVCLSHIQHIVLG
jgi:hypothetical protein